MLLRLAYYGDRVLRQKVQPVEKIDDSLRSFIADMIETMHHFNGAGLAAPQVHRPIAVMLTYISNKDEEGEKRPPVERVFINPKLLSSSEESWIHIEGCLSIPGVYEEVERPVSIEVEVTTLEGEIMKLHLEGWEARAFLHENDHLNGVLFFDRIRGKKRLQLEPLLKKVKKKYSS